MDRRDARRGRGRILNTAMEYQRYWSENERQAYRLQKEFRELWPEYETPNELARQLVEYLDGRVSTRDVASLPDEAPGDGVMAGADGLMSPAGVARKVGSLTENGLPRYRLGRTRRISTHVALPDSGVVVRGMDYAGAGPLSWRARSRCQDRRCRPSGLAMNFARSSRRLREAASGYGQVGGSLARTSNRSRSFTRKSDASRFEVDVRRARQLGRPLDIDRGAETLAAFVSVYWRRYAVLHLADKTRMDYRGAWVKHVLPGSADTGSGM